LKNTTLDISKSERGINGGSQGLLPKGKMTILDGKAGWDKIG
jgi:hypothetical protein